MTTNKINSASDMAEGIIDGMSEDVIKLWKFVFEKLSPKKRKEKKEYLNKISLLIRTLSKEQINLFIELIKYTEKFGWVDFNVTHTIEKERPEEKDKLREIFKSMALDKAPTSFIKKELESQKEVNDIKKEKESDENTKDQKINDLKSEL